MSPQLVSAMDKSYLFLTIERGKFFQVVFFGHLVMITMEDLEELSTLKRFGKKYYITWKFQVQAFLSGKGLLKIVDDIEVTHVLITSRSMSIHFGGASSVDIDSPNTSLAQKKAKLNENKEFKKKDSLSNAYTISRQNGLT